MKPLHEYSYKNLLLPDKVRKKSSFSSEFWSLIIQKFLPWNFQFPDIRTIISRKKKELVINKIDELFFEDATEEHSESDKLRNQLRIDAVEAFNDLANIINGELQNLYINDRLNLLKLDAVFLSGMPTSEKQRNKIRHQLASLSNSIEQIRASYKNEGVIVQLSYRAEKLYDDIELAHRILFLTDENKNKTQIFEALKRFIDEFKPADRLRDFVKEKSLVLVKTVVEHNSESGGKYIAGRGKEYLKMWKAGLIGGILIAIFALFKVKIESFGLSLLGEGILFSVNYALCFILVDMFGGAIATKQPAMTANTLTKCIFDNPEGVSAKDQIVRVIADTSKSQFASFLGNVIIAFVFSFLITYIADVYMNVQLIKDDKASYLIERNDILSSGAIFYAAIAGVFLSLSGFISGYTDNAVLYYQLKKRLQKKYKKNSFLVRALCYSVKKTGKFTGNVVLGFFLGMSGAIGLFSGIPFDIRHVAFSTSHIAYGSYTQVTDWFSEIGLLIFLSILIIGFVNFFISFLITLFIALNAQEIRFKDIRGGFLKAFIMFFMKPWMFILPVRFELNNTKKA
jgi:site-specific recombinase